MMPPARGEIAKESNITGLLAMSMRLDIQNSTYPEGHHIIGLYVASKQ